MNPRYTFDFVMPRSLSFFDKFIIILQRIIRRTSYALPRAETIIIEAARLELEGIKPAGSLVSVATDADDLVASNAERTPTVLCIVLCASPV